MSTIYVMTKGEYSDYYIVGTTSNKEIAYAFAKLHDCEVETFEDFQDSSIIKVADELVLAYFFEFDEYGKILEVSKEYVMPNSDLNLHDGEITIFGRYKVGVINNDEEMAKKIACDKRSKFLARYYDIM